MTPDFVVQGTDVFVEGSGTHTVVMVHGWPDTYRLWDGAVQALQAQYRCVRFTFPGFDEQSSQASNGMPTLAQRTAHLLAIIDRASPDQPVTLLLHDWGCFFGYELAARHPDRVSRIVGMDIGDTASSAYLKSLTVGHKLMILFYQWWLAVSWLVGRYVNGTVADAMTRTMARFMRCPAPPAGIRWFMNFPYAMAWLGAGGGMRSALPFKPHCPMLYLYGKRKPFMFHSQRWLEKLNTTPGSKAVGLSSGHWVMLDRAAEFEAQVLEWLADRQPASDFDQRTLPAI
jgi:pimeloyl-ACP methyl ester carboxylesterase